MTQSPFTLIDEQKAFEITATISGRSVRIAPDTVASTLGWRLESSGLCRGSVCIPTAGAEDFATAEGIDLQQLAERLGRPLALDVEHRVAALAAAPSDRRAALASLAAPDFTLPDLTGKLHSLSDHRGKKALLVAYASW